MYRKYAPGGLAWVLAFLLAPWIWYYLEQFARYIGIIGGN